MELAPSTPNTATATLVKWAQWIGLSAAGVSFAWLVSGAFPRQAVTLLVLLGGTTGGIAQYLYFRPLRRASLWIAPAILTSPCLGLATLAMVYPPQFAPPLEARIAQSSILLALMALSQYFVLRKWFFRAGVWIPTATIAWLFAFIVVDRLMHGQRPPFLPDLPGFAVLALLGAFVGGVYGIITGAVLASLKSRPPSGA